MLTGALVCPHPPMLLPGLTGAASLSRDVAPDLWRACRDGVGELLAAGPQTVVVVGGAGDGGVWDAGLPRGAGRFSAGRVGRPARPSAAGGAPALPLSLAVGEELLDAGGWAGPRDLRSVAFAATPAQCAELGRELAGRPGRTALLVLGDGSARRGLKAPGYLDERAADYDGQALRGLAGDVAALADLDAGLGAELLAAGRAAWQVLAGAAAGSPGPPGAAIRYADDPFGVWYIVASWRFAPPAAART